MASSAEARGYHRLADLMGYYPEAAIFRRFGSLNMLNLLSLQAELVDLQVQFRDIWAEDNSSLDLNEKDYSTYFRKLRQSENSLQYEMLLNIRRLLREYSTLASPKKICYVSITTIRRRSSSSGASCRITDTART